MKNDTLNSTLIAYKKRNIAIVSTAFSEKLGPSWQPCKLGFSFSIAPTTFEEGDWESFTVGPSFEIDPKCPLYKKLKTENVF